MYDTSELAVISFVQDTATHEVYQAGYSPTVLDINDAGISSLSLGFGCDSASPVAVLHNFGNAALTSCLINYKIDNGAVLSASWSGNLASGSSVNVNLPNILDAGNHTLLAFTSNPNGTADVFHGNDTALAAFGTAYPAQTGTFSETFAALFPPANCVLGSSDGTSNWKLASVGGFGTSVFSTKFDAYNFAAGITADFYPPAINLASNSYSVQCTFDVAYARYDSTSEDTLKVRVSTDCGITWVTVYSKSDTSLATAPNTTALFSPLSAQWRLETIDLTPFNGHADVQLQFHGISGYGNDIYVDNIDAAIATGIAAIPGTNGLHIYPNPATGNVNIQLSNALENGALNLFSVDGQSLMHLNNLTGNTFSLDISNQAKGVYILQIIDGQTGFIGTEKIVLQ